MNPDRIKRRLAAILAADVAGYSRLMEADEEGTLAALKAIRRELSDPKIAEHRGRIVKTTGDGLLAEFASVVDAVRCAVEVQREMIARNAAAPAERRIEFRMGINVGDIIIEDGDIFGDGVNIAARLEALAVPGGICLSGAAHEQVRDRLDLTFDDLGEQQVKNIARPVRTYGVALGASSRAALPVAAPLPLPDKPSLAVLPFQNMSGDPEQDYFVDGMVEEITTAIARLPWLFRDRPQFEFYVQGQAGRREAGSAGARRALRARRQRAQSRQPGAHHRAIDRHDDRRPHLGRPLRRRARRHFRVAGSGRVQRRRRDRTKAAPNRDRARQPQAGREPHRL